MAAWRAWCSAWTGPDAVPRAFLILPFVTAPDPAARRSPRRDFNLYSGIWTDKIMRDVQEYILEIIKRRCEGNTPHRR
jgi:hypothetical protein